MKQNDGCMELRVLLHPAAPRWTPVRRVRSVATVASVSQPSTGELRISMSAAPKERTKMRRDMDLIRAVLLKAYPALDGR